MESIGIKHRTIYSSLPLQVFMIHTIKNPTLFGIQTLFNPEASKMDKIKAFKELWKAYHAISKMPEPTLENTWHPNSHNLIRLRDWLFGKMKQGDLRMGFIRRIMNFIIILYDFDPPWRWIFDSLKDEALEMNWKPRGFEDDWIYDWWTE